MSVFRSGQDEIPANGKWAVITGGTVTTYTSGGFNYEIHTFLANDTLTCSKGGLVDMLLVGGGGGGGSYYGGAGGGAGGFAEMFGVYLQPGAHAVVVGAGGQTASPRDYGDQDNGGISAVGMYSVPGGGAGGGDRSSGRSGASGGGEAYSTDDVGNGQAPWGYSGGTSYDATGNTGGGGGGAGGVGQNAPSATVGGAGGPGAASSIRTGSPITYCGGGGGSGSGTGGAGGSGLGGAGASAGGLAGAVSGPNTGSGGGGKNTATTQPQGTPGSSGIVVVRTVTQAPSPSGIIMSGGTESTYTGDGTNGVLGQTYKLHAITALGASTLTVTQFPRGATCDLLVIGGGGGGYDSGGGGGGMLEVSDARLPVGSVDVIVGAGGTAAATGNYAGWGFPSSVGQYLAYGGGAGGRNSISAGGIGGSGGGGFTIAGPPVPGQGYAGAVGNSVAGGGAGGAASGATAGPGKVSRITGSAVTYSAGGAGTGGPINGAVNTGNGSTGYADGGRGVVYIRYKI